MSGISKEFFRRVYLRDRMVLIPIIVAVVLQLLTWGFLLWQGLALRGEANIPLHYNIYFGVDLIGPWYGIFFPAGFGFLALLINIVFIGIAYEWQRLLSYLFSLGTVLVELILLVASVFIILLNS